VIFCAEAVPICLPTTNILKKELFDDRIGMIVEYGPRTKYDPKNGSEQFNQLYQHQFPILPVNECRKDIRKSIKENPQIKVTRDYQTIDRTVCILTKAMAHSYFLKI